MVFNFSNKFSSFSSNVFFLCFFFIPVQLCSDRTCFSKFFCNRILYFQFVPELCESHLDQEVPGLVLARGVGVWLCPLQGASEPHLAGREASWLRTGRAQDGCHLPCPRQRLEKEGRLSRVSKPLSGRRTSDGTSWSEENTFSSSHHRCLINW